MSEYNLKVNIQSDVIVVAAGTAGMAAAVTAAEQGAKVVVFEKTGHTGGTANMARGIFAVESRIQREKMIALTRDEAFRLHMEFAHWRVDPLLVRAHIDRSAEIIEWLEKLGVKFEHPSAYYPGSFFTQHAVRGEEALPSAATVVKVLTQRAQEMGVRFFLKTPVKKIIKEDGRIKGVIAEDENKNELVAMAPAVIVATGGFGSHPEWIKEYTGIDPDLIQAYRMPGGEGIRLAWEVGAGRTQMTVHLNDQIQGIFRESPFVWAAFRQPNLMVNLLGERFVNEELVSHSTFMGSALVRQKKGCGYMMFDEDTKSFYVANGLDMTNILFGDNKKASFDEELPNLLDRGVVIRAYSLEEMAKKTGINITGLKQTVDEYNGFCNKGHDDIFNKQNRYLRPLRRPPFYAAKYVPGAFGTLGGIKINHRTEVITEDFEVIPGLYAAGSDANSIYGDSYILMMPGNTMGFAFTSGRIAGENAAKYALSHA